MRTAWVMLVMVLVTAASLMPARGMPRGGVGGLVGVGMGNSSGVCVVEPTACPCGCEVGECGCCASGGGQDERGKEGGVEEGVEVGVVGVSGCPCQPVPSRSGERPVQATPGVLVSRAGTLTGVGRRLGGGGEDEPGHAGAVKLVMVGRGLGAVGQEAGRQWRRVRDVMAGELVLRRSELCRWTI